MTAHTIDKARQNANLAAPCWFFSICACLGKQMARLCTTLTLTLWACLAHAQASLDRPDESAIQTEIEAALVNRVDDAKNTVGIIVGFLGPEGRRYLARGASDRRSGTKITEDTIFEIGSLTKIFTSLLLADMVDRGEVALHDPIDDYLPGDVVAPSFDGKRITLVDLATHCSGLPVMPGTNLSGFSDLYDYLSTYQLEAEPGSRYQYSNLGLGLLGHLLSLRAGTSFERLLEERILEPLGMSDTTISLSDSQRDRMATGHDGMRNPVGSTDIHVLAGAGALRSTARDMLTLAEAQLELRDHPLQPAMRSMLSVTHPTGRPDRVAHLGWAEIDGTTLFHIGVTRGFSSAFSVRPDIRQAVIVLSNSRRLVDTIALHGVMPERPITFYEVAEKLSEDRAGARQEVD